jgi:hypothetical protein
MTICDKSTARCTLTILCLAAAAGCARSQAQDNGAQAKAPAPPRCGIGTITDKFWMGCSDDTAIQTRLCSRSPGSGMRSPAKAA